MKPVIQLVLSIIVLSTLLFGCSLSSMEQSDAVSGQMNSNTRNDAWSFVGPGGGGAMFNPAINPANPNHAFVSCDMTGSFVTYDGGEHWRMFNLRGVVKFYVFDPDNSDIVYAGTSNMLFKSEDRGNSWSVVYPAPHDIVGLTARGDHANEQVVTKDSIVETIEKMVIDPGNPTSLYLLISSPVNANGQDQKSSFSKLKVSNDAGVRWEEIRAFDARYDNVFIDPTSSKGERTLYVSSKEKFMARIGGIWNEVRLPENVGTITQYVDGLDEKTNQHFIYVISGESYFNRRGNPKSSGIYRTTDGGESWIDIGKNFLDFQLEGTEDPEFRSIAISYSHPEHIYVSYNNLQIGEDSISFGVAKSGDGGQSWQLAWNDLYVNGKGISSPNRESGWLDQRFGPGWGENPFHVAVHKNNPSICFTTDFGRTIKTTDGGKTWQQVYTRKLSNGHWKSRGLQVTTGYKIVFDPFDSLHCFLADTDTGLMESIDSGESWSSATHDNGVPSRWVNSTYWMVFDPEVKGRVWAAMSRNHDLPRPKMWRNMDMQDYEGGVLRSEDGGTNWEPVSDDIGESAITHIVLDKKSDPEKRALYACAFGKGVYKSTDGGFSWEQKNKGIEERQPAAWRITRKSNGELFLIVFRKSEDGSIGTNSDGALYRSSDGAETWEKMKLPDNVNGPSSLLVDPKDADRLILSAWGRYGEKRFSNDQGGGIYLSENDGKTWIPVLTEDQHIHDVTVGASVDVLYACGFNSSAYRSDDRGYTWQRIRGYNFKWGKRVQPDPYDKEKIYIITFGGGVWHGPAKGDPNALEDILTPKVAYTHSKTDEQ